MYMLSSEEQRIALKMAQQINSGIITTSVVVEEIQKDDIGWIPIIAFWLSHDNATKLVVNKLINEKNYQLRSYVDDVHTLI